MDHYYSRFESPSLYSSSPPSLPTPPIPTPTPKCQTLDPESWTGKIVNLVMSACTLSVLVFVFLTIFFFTYVRTVERDIFRNEVGRVIDNVKESRDAANQYLGIPSRAPKTINVKVYPDDVKKWEQKNHDTLMSSITLCAIVFGALILLTGVMYYFFCIDLMHIWGRALLYLVFIGLVEYMFLALVTSQFMTVSAVETKQKLLVKLSQV